MVQRAIRLTLALLLIFPAYTFAQESNTFRVSQILPFDRGVPGQILELQVEGLGGASDLVVLKSADFQIEITQDGIKQQVKARTASPTMTRESKPDGTMGEFQSQQRVTFVVPQGLHPGNTELVVLYQGKAAPPITLTIVARPLPPSVGTVAIMTVNPSSVPSPNRRAGLDDLGWRLERDSTAEVHVAPLVDPEDPNSAILIRFKQGANWFPAVTRVVHRDTNNEQFTGGGRIFSPPRDSFEVDVPAGLTLGQAEIEIRERANGQESDPVTFKVQITDTTRSAEAPSENAPRVLALTPRKIGAGQSIMLSIDYLRTLKPDPAQTMIMIEQGTGRYIVKPDVNTAEHLPNWTPDVPVVLMARVTNQLVGSVQVRVFNSLRGEQGGLSEPQSLEIVNEAMPPEVTGVGISTDAELSQLRQIYEAATRMGQRFAEYDPQRTYFTIRGSGFDPNPNLVKVTLEQDGQREVLSLQDYSFYGGNFLILRVPKGFKPGRVLMTIQQRGADSYSAPITREFQLSRAS